MGMKFGEIDITNQIVDNEFRLGFLELVIQDIINRNDNIIKPTLEELESFRKMSIEKLQVKYPNSGIKYSKPQV